MPEGPEIRIAADRIAKAIAFKPIKEIFFAFEHLKLYEDILAKQLVIGIDTKGKGMLIRFLAGLGNYLRSEILFVARVHPTLRPIDCSSEQISTLATAALKVPRQSYQTKRLVAK